LTGPKELDNVRQDRPTGLSWRKRDPMNLKERIVEESLRLFTLKGFLSTSMNDILAASQASKGGFYNHFSSKEELFFDVLSVARKHWRRKNLVGMDRVDSPVEKLRIMLDNYRDRYLKDTERLPGGCPFIMLSVELADQKPALIKELNKGFSGLKKMIARLVEEGKEKGELGRKIDTVAVTELVFAGMLGASVMFGVDKSFTRLDAAIASLIDYLDSLAPKPTHNTQ